MKQVSFIAPTTDSMNQLLPAFEFVSLIMSNAEQAVYLANQKSLDRHVAIKLHSPEGSADEDFKDAFETMARQMAKLNHVNLIGVFNSGVVNGMLYLVMEFVPGKPLHQLMKGNAFDSKKVAGIMDGLSSGLDRAHRAGILHGGLSPLNVLVTPEYEPKIGNFGFVSSSSDEDDPSSRYAAPELFDDDGELSALADVYSLGVMLYELYTGKPFVIGVVPPQLTLPAGRKVLEIIKKATAKDPTQRYSSIVEFQVACMQVLSNRVATDTIKVKLATVAAEGTPRGVAKPHMGRKPNAGGKVHAGPKINPGPPRPQAAAPIQDVSAGERMLKLLLRCIVYALLFYALFLAWKLREQRKRAAEGLPNTQHSEVGLKDLIVVSPLKPVSEADTDARC